MENFNNQSSRRLFPLSAQIAVKMGEDGLSLKDKGVIAMKKLIQCVATVLIAGSLFACTAGERKDAGMLAGGVVGGVAGSSLTGGSTAGTVAGAVGGAYVGRQLSN